MSYIVGKDRTHIRRTIAASLDWETKLAILRFHRWS